MDTVSETTGVGTNVADSRIYEYVVSKEGRWKCNIKHMSVLYNNVMLLAILLLLLLIIIIYLLFTKKKQFKMLLLPENTKQIIVNVS